MERQIPKNVRQIGNVSDTPKIYVEDYVDTFFTQLCEKAVETPIGAFLVGDLVQCGEEEYVYIYGAIQMHDLKMSGTEYVLDEDTWKTAYEDCKQYFDDGEMLGWFVARPGAVFQAENSTVKLHKKSFPKENTIFILKDSIEQEEMYYVHKCNDLMEVGGHYTYYEKNPCMQNYMISTRKKNGVCPSETVEDRAAKDFRSIVRARGERQTQKRTSHLMYAMSACLVLFVIAMGVVTMNNYDKMNAVKSAIAGIGGSSEPDRKEEEIQETSGTVSAVPEEEQEVTEPQPQEEVPVDGREEGDTNEVTGGDDLNSGSMDMQEGNGSDGIYVVESGDTLAMISKKMYGDISHTDAISKMNGLSDGNLIYVGQKLLLP